MLVHIESDSKRKPTPEEKFWRAFLCVVIALVSAVVGMGFARAVVEAWTR